MRRRKETAAEHAAVLVENANLLAANVRKVERKAKAKANKVLAR